MTTDLMNTMNTVMQLITPIAAFLMALVLTRWVWQFARRQMTRWDIEAEEQAHAEQTAWECGYDAGYRNAVWEELDRVQAEDWATDEADNEYSI